MKVDVTTDEAKKAVVVSLEGDRKKLMVDVPGMSSLASHYNNTSTSTSFDTAKGVSTFTAVCKTEEDMENLHKDLKQFFFQK